MRVYLKQIPILLDYSWITESEMYIKYVGVR